MVEASAAAATAGTSWVTALLNYWWLFLLFGGAVLEWVGETFDVGVAALRRRAKAKRKHQLELKRLELEIAQAHSAPAGAALSPAPGLCRHRKAVPVRTSEGDTVAWLCRSCDTKLPAEFSVYEEDL